MPSGKDPRSYIKAVALPIPSTKGIRLEARDTFNYNLSEPTREVVRRGNYERRQNQMSNMGFRSAQHKPYMGIGDPFYLDEQKLILHALGQWHEDEQETSSSSESDTEQDDRSDGKRPAFTAAKFVLRRSRKDLNTLNKAVVQGRGMMRNVGLGHGLFDLINKEKQRKKNLADAELRRQRELQRNEFVPPKAVTNNESDDDMENDVDIANFLVPVAPPTFLTQQQTDTDEELEVLHDNSSDSDHSPEREPDVVTFHGMALAEAEEELELAKSAVATSEMTSTFSRPISISKKKPQNVPRPYTPQHTNISTNVSTRESVAETVDVPEPELDDISKDALFRQLCVLHWVLEAMSTDPPSAMTPIMSAWSLSDIGGSRALPKKLTRDRVTETNWTNFLTASTGRRMSVVGILAALRATKRLSAHRQSSKSPIRRPLTSALKSPQSSGGSQAGSSSGLGMLASQMSLLSARTQPREPIERAVSPRPEASDGPVSKSIFKFLDEYYASLKWEQEQKEKKARGDTSPSPPSTPTPEKQKKKRHKDRDDSTGKKSRKKSADHHEGEKRLDHKVAVALGEEETMSSKFLRANSHLIRPKSSPALLEFQASLPSNRRSNLRTDLHNQFAECREEKALTLHDILDHKESQRMTVCKSKFVALQSATRSSSFYRAVDQMRTQSWHNLRKPYLDKRKSIQKGNWYTDIMEKIPFDLRQEWFYSKILEKLGRFGLVEGTGKQSIYKFLKVLQGLREWEICSPDISAAVEFCRERIVEMTVEEYELWFKQQFPRVTRPQTAPPPVSKTERPSGVETRDSTPAPVHVRPIRAVQSAMTRRTQR